jgi:hypothetical protein
VRHGDALQDTRGELNLTRTLAAHMSCASKLTSEMSLPNIFLASDNNTLFDIVARKYPQFNWFAQKRVIKAYDGNMYQHMNEKSHNKEIANLLVSQLSSSIAHLHVHYRVYCSILLIVYSSLCYGTV